MPLPAPFRDNPLILKHVRTRLRPPALGGPAAVVLLAAGGITYMGTENSVQDGVAFTGLVALAAILVMAAGAAQVSASLAHARETGLLDFQRISLQTPASLAAGYLLGAPVREWLLAAFTVPFLLYVVARGWPPPLGLGITAAVFASAALLYHAAALLAVLVVPRPRLAGALVVTLVVGLNLLTGNAHGAEAALTVGPTCREVLSHPGGSLPADAFFGHPISAAALALVHQLPLLLFVLIPVMRRLGREGSPFYSKAGAVAFQCVLALLVLGDAWDRSPTLLIPQQATLYSLLFSGILLAAAVTPDRDAALEERRSGRAPSRRRGWSEADANQAALLALAGIVVAAGLAAPAPAGAGIGQRLLPALAAGCAVLYVGAGRQFALYRFGRPGGQVLVLAVAGLWCLPAVVSGLLATRVAAAENLRQGIASVSPLLGINLGLAAGSGDSSLLAGAVALAVSAGLAFLALRGARSEERRLLARAESPIP